MKITKQIKAVLPGAVEDICRAVKLKRHRFGYERLALMYWSRQEFEAVKVAKNLIERDCFDYTSKVFKLEVEVEHELIQPTMKKVIVQVNSGGEAGVCLWPRDMTDVRDEADPADVAALQDAVTDMVKQAIDLTLLRKVTTYLFAECETHEQIRYLFPPYMQILSKADHPEIVDQISTIKAMPKNLPPVDLRLRNEIKYLIQWFTIQQLLGTFEQRMIYYEGDNMGCDVSVGENIYFKDSDGRTVPAIFK